jgi:hypothetical protein
MADESENMGVSKADRRRFSEALKADTSLSERIVAFVCWREGYSLQKASEFIGSERRTEELLHSTCSKIRGRRRRQENERRIGQRNLSPTKAHKRGEQSERCRIPGCDHEGRTRGLCPNHYRKWREAGKPAITKFVAQFIPDTRPREEAAPSTGEDTEATQSD